MYSKTDSYRDNVGDAKIKRKVQKFNFALIYL